jgi:hypothetical protein
MGEHPGRDRLDGAWWPQSRDLAVEVADLVDHFPLAYGRVVRALYSPPDWDSRPRRIPASGRDVKVGCFPRDDTHQIDLTMSDRTVLRMLVVPPGLSADQGEEAMLAAATPGNDQTAGSLLDTATEFADVDPADHWRDDGGAWWHPHPIAPSFRAGP